LPRELARRDGPPDESSAREKTTIFREERYLRAT
jgi:hypothetical protein